MMNAAMLIAPAASAGDMPSAGKATEGQGQFFGQALAQQEHRQFVSQDLQQQQGQPAKAGNFAFVNRFFGLFEQEVKPEVDVSADQQGLFDPADIDAELLDQLVLLMESGTVPETMDQADLLQLLDLVENAIDFPELWHQQAMAMPQEIHDPAAQQQELTVPQQELTVPQQMEELLTLINQYVTEQSGHKEAQTESAVPQQAEQGLVAAQTREQLHTRLQQLRAAIQQAGMKENQAPVDKAVVEGTSADTTAPAARMIDAPIRVNGDDATKSPLESRFSELLQPRQQRDGQVRGAEPGRNSQQPQQQPPATPSAEVVFAKVAEQVKEPFALHKPATAVKPVVDGGGQQQNPLHAQQSPVPATQTISIPTPVTTPFAASQPVADSQIFDQVVTHLSGSLRGDAGRMVLRLHPAELGALKIELMVEGDRVRANLHAQTQQVQEVLERNLGQLRSALADQGLKIDHFQVSSDGRQNQHQGQAEDLAHQHREAERFAPAEQNDQEDLPEDQAIPLEHLTQNSGRGISLHV
ncbi:MAG: flagellar hook-length control protein FliK [Pelovirga sp.]